MAWDRSISLALALLTLIPLIFGRHLASTKWGHKWLFHIPGLLMLEMIAIAL
jgi:hypothetical protein